MPIICVPIELHVEYKKKENIIIINVPALVKLWFIVREHLNTQLTRSAFIEEVINMIAVVCVGEDLP